MDPDRRFQTQELLDDLVEHLDSPHPAERLFRSIAWEASVSIARTQALLGVVREALIAWEALTKPTENEPREGFEQALWLRKLAEHLSVLICFAERDDPRDYWLWLTLTANQESRRVSEALSEQLTITPLPSQLRRVVGLSQSNTEILARGLRIYEPHEDPPWFMSTKRWRSFLASKSEAVQRWEPPSMRAIIERARPRAHGFEISVMGHYQLAYGRYSTQIHARLSGNQALGPPLEDELLWLSIIAVAHRIASLVNHRHHSAQLLAARTVTDLRGSLRFDGPPLAGELVELLPEEHATVLEVARDATLALVERQSDQRTEVRRTIELLRPTKDDG